MVAATSSRMRRVEDVAARSQQARSSAAGVGFGGGAAGRVDGEHEADQVVERVGDPRVGELVAAAPALGLRRRPGRSRAGRPGGWTGSAATRRSCRRVRTDSPAPRAASTGSRRGSGRTARTRTGTGRRCGCTVCMGRTVHQILYSEKAELYLRGRPSSSQARWSNTQSGDRRSLNARNPSRASGEE